MTATLLVEQLLNGLQFGLMLFLIAAGLTLVFGIMDVLNLAHGSLYMIGAYVAASVAQATGSFWIAVPAAVVATGLVGLALEVTLIRKLYRRDHLSQVLATFAVDPDRRRCGKDPVGTGPDHAVRARRAGGAGRTRAGPALSRVPAAAHRGRTRAGAGPVPRSSRRPAPACWCAPVLPADPSTAQRFGDGEGSCGAAIEPGVPGRTAFTLRVQTGCAEPCAYCIIPVTRGRPRSVPIDAIVTEVERVVTAGFKEIVLTGVHLGSYGRDLSPRSSLINLLDRIDRHGISYSRGAPPPLAGTASQSLGLERRLSASGEGCGAAPPPSPLFRISSLEPMDCGPDVVDLVANSGRFAPHFHLPLQHASNRVLARMRRPYTIERYAALVDLIRKRMPDASIGSDVIVGFPGETHEDFEELASYLDRSPLTHVHVFPYSDRPGTAATAMDAKVPGAVVRERGRRVREIGQRLTSRFRESQVGTVHRGLTLEDGSLVVTGNYLKVRIPPGHQRNQWVNVRVLTAADPMTGESVE